MKYYLLISLTMITASLFGCGGGGSDGRSTESSGDSPQSASENSLETRAFNYPSLYIYDNDEAARKLVGSHNGLPSSQQDVWFTHLPHLNDEDHVIVSNEGNIFYALKTSYSDPSFPTHFYHDLFIIKIDGQTGERSIALGPDDYRNSDVQSWGCQTNAITETAGLTFDEFYYIEPTTETFIGEFQPCGAPWETVAEKVFVKKLDGQSAASIYGDDIRNNMMTPVGQNLIAYVSEEDIDCTNGSYWYANCTIKQISYVDRAEETEGKVAILDQLVHSRLTQNFLRLRSPFDRASVFIDDKEISLDQQTLGQTVGVDTLAVLDDGDLRPGSPEPIYSVNFSADAMIDGCAIIKVDNGIKLNKQNFDPGLCSDIGSIRRFFGSDHALFSGIIRTPIYDENGFQTSIEKHTEMQIVDLSSMRIIERAPYSLTDKEKNNYGSPSTGTSYVSTKIRASENGAYMLNFTRHCSEYADNCALDRLAVTLRETNTEGPARPVVTIAGGDPLTNGGNAGNGSVIITDSDNPNDDDIPSGATPIMLGQQAEGTLSNTPLDRGDIFRLQSDRTGSINIILSDYDTSDLDMGLTTSNMVEIDSSTSSEPTESITFEATKNTEYLILVYPYSLSNDPQGYKLRVD